NNIAKKEKLKITTRIKGYSFLLLAIASALFIMLATRDSVDITILRTQGMIYQTLPDGYIGNLYSARMFNKTHQDIEVSLSIPTAEGSIEIIGKKPLITKESYAVITFLVKKKANLIKKRKSEVEIEVRAAGKKLSTKETTFIGPISS
ncbi:MAG: cytochrome c oxidase accessory protein CcoG, partial [Bacteroidota bacterium]